MGDAAEPGPAVRARGHLALDGATPEVRKQLRESLVRELVRTIEKRSMRSKDLYQEPISAQDLIEKDA